MSNKVAFISDPGVLCVSCQCPGTYGRIAFQLISRVKTLRPSTAPDNGNNEWEGRSEVDGDQDLTV